MFLLDTNIVSELRNRHRAHPSVLSWAERVSRADLRLSVIAATALVHRLTVVTRNEKDFKPMGVPLLNPWRG